MVEFRDVVKKYAGTDEALGVPAGTVGGIPVVTPDDLGPAAAMTPAEVVTDPDAHAALSGAFAPLDRVAAMQDPESVVWFDTANRADNASSPNPADSGGSYTVPSGVWGVSGGYLRRQDTSSAYTALLVDAGAADQVIEASVQVAGTTPDAVFLLRVTDLDTCLLVKITAAGVRLWKRVAGTETQLAAWSTASQIGLRRRLRVSAVGAVVTCVDAITGQAVGAAHTLTGGDETTFASQTTVGIGDRAPTVERMSGFKNLVVRTPF